MNRQKKSSLHQTYRQFLQTGLGMEDSKKLKGIVDEKLMGFGTTIDEKIMNFAQLREVIKQQKKQRKGMDFQWKVKSLSHYTSTDENTAVFADEVFLKIVAGGETVKMYMRFSIVISYIHNQWKVIHWHGSKPENVQSAEDTFGIENWKQKAEALEKIVKERTASLVEKNQELEIEAALEKVRTVALSLKKSDEMLDVAQVLFEQLSLLGFTEIRNTIIDIHDHQTETFMEYDYSKAMSGSVTRMSYHDDSFIEEQVRKIESSNDAFFELVLEEKRLQALINLRTKNGKKPDPRLLKIDQLTYNLYSFGNGAIGISNFGVLNNEQKKILERFRNVFTFVYKRYSELTQSESQTRETQIELALERVRARTMAMHNSNELSEVAVLLFEQVKQLGIEAYTSGFNIWDKEMKNVIAWMSNPTGEIIPPLTMNIHASKQHKITYNAWKNKKSFFENDIKGNDIIKHYEFLRTIPFYKDAIKHSESAGIATPTRLIHNIAFFAHGYLLFITLEPCPQFKNTFIRFANVFEQTYTRFLDLQKAEEQVKEAQIEAGLERVRSRAMAMQNSEELNSLIGTVFTELTKLDVRFTRCAILIYEGNEKGLRQWMANSETPSMPMSFFVVHSDLPYFNALKKGLNERSLKWEYLLEGQNKFLTDEFLFKETELARLPEFVIAGMRAPERVYISASFNLFGCVTLASLEPLPDKHFDILLRFAKVFELTYTRFNDLQVAEAQAKEAQIEAALERVRGRSMAMHKSDELKEVIRLVLEQFVDLKINVQHAGFYIDYKNQDDMHIWLADPNLEPFFATFPYFDTPTWNSFLEAKAKGTTFHTDLLDFKEKNKFYKSLFQLFTIPEEAKQFYMQCKGLAVSTVMLDNVGLYIENFDAIPYSEEENKILLRFGKVFQQTYTRFLDLQKAEAQAREAQIEAALEKIRSRSLAMHQSNELKEVIAVVFENLNELKVALGSVAIWLFDKKTMDTVFWVATHLQHPDQINLPYDKVLMKAATCYRDSWQAWLSGKSYFNKEYNKQQKDKYFNYVFSHNDVKTIPRKARNLILEAEKHNASLVVEKNFTLFFDSWNGATYSKESISVFQRTAKVFQQAYVRFLDLQKSEAQARENQIQLALERVRAKTMAMQKSAELLPTAEIMFDQLKQLGAELQGVAFAICDKDSTIVQKWTSIGNFSHPYNIEPGEQRMYEAWKNQSGMYEEVYEGEKQKKYYELFMQIPEFRDGLQKVIDMGFPIPTWQKNYAVPFKNGYVLFIITKPFDETQIFLRFGKVFEQTYTRFLDLQKAEAQTLQAEQDMIEIKKARKKAEEALGELQATQKQLIQSEKMASLGELTAGIAHEIQNPLNFVNNFSEVSNELIDEMKEELVSGHQHEAIELADDIKQNLEKINHHGKRADAIVKGMLQHSRASTGKKEPTDINALCDEYLRLSYHGLRAKDTTFNAEMKTDFDSSIGKINIVPQDIGRVLLNIINNAFFAVAEKHKDLLGFKNLLGLEEYSPTVSVQTKRIKDKSDSNRVEIIIKDNGNGIPKNIVDKIFQPFFTTKPTGQGTGLGLSLAYDIVKAHGGEIKVDALPAEAAAQAGKESEGSVFRIQLPAE